MSLISTGSPGTARPQLSQDPGPRQRPIHEARTDEDGEFRLAPPSEGLYRVRVEATGSVTAETAILPVVESLRLPPLHLPARVARTASDFDSPWGPASPPDAAPPDLPTRHVKGTVVDAASRAPLAGALVWQVGREEHSALSDARGRFDLEAEGALQVELVGVARGYLMASRSFRSPETPISLVLVAGISASGRTVDPRNRAVAGARVELRAPGGLVGDPRSSTASDRQGRFRVCCLAAAGSGTIIASRDRYATERLRLESRAGKPSAVRLVLSPTRPVAGTVLDSRRTAISSADVVLRPETERDAAPLKTETDAAGRFRLDAVPSGRYDLTVAAPGWPPASTQGLEVPPGDDDLRLAPVVLADGGAIEGEVVDPDAVPIAGARVEAQPSAPKEAASTRRFETTTGPDGSFRLDGLASGSLLDLRVTADGHAPGIAADVEVPPAEPLRIVLDPGARLTGTVVDQAGRPVARAVVRAAPRGGSGNLSTTTSTDPKGRFETEALETGEIDLVATASGYSTARTTVTIEPNLIPADLEIELSRGASLQGVVRDPAGNPISGALIEAARDIGPGPRPGDYRVTSSEKAGRFALAGLEAGRWWISAQAPGFRPLVQELDLGTDGSDADPVDLRLSAGTEVAGRTLDPRGEPVAGAYVELVPAHPVARRYPFFRPELPPRAVSGPDGSFRLSGAGPGEYRLRASHPAYATSEAPEEIRVDGPTVDGLVLYLETGAGVAGRLMGVGLIELRTAEVAAISMEPKDGRPIVRGEVRANGLYVISELPVGRWLVVASVHDRGIVATETVEITGPGQQERVDFDLTAALQSSRASTDPPSRRASAPTHQRR